MVTLKILFWRSVWLVGTILFMLFVILPYEFYRWLSDWVEDVMSDIEYRIYELEQHRLNLKQLKKHISKHS